MSEKINNLLNELNSLQEKEKQLISLIEKDLENTLNLIREQKLYSVKIQDFESASKYRLDEIEILTELYKINSNNKEALSDSYIIKTLINK